MIFSRHNILSFINWLIGLLTLLMFAYLMFKGFGLGASWFGAGLFGVLFVMLAHLLLPKYTHPIYVKYYIYASYTFMGLYVVVAITVFSKTDYSVQFVIRNILRWLLCLKGWGSPDNFIRITFLASPLLFMLAGLSLLRHVQLKEGLRRSYYRLPMSADAKANQYYKQAKNQEKLRSEEKAMSIYDKALSHDHTFARVLVDKGILHCRMGEFVLARQLFEEALKYEPDSAHIYENLSKVELELANTVKSISHHETCMRKLFNELWG